jgi:hypothetical protein
MAAGTRIYPGAAQNQHGESLASTQQSSTVGQELYCDLTASATSDLPPIMQRRSTPTPPTNGTTPVQQTHKPAKALVFFDTTKTVAAQQKPRYMTAETPCRTPDLTVAIPDDPLYNIGDASFFWGHLGGTFGRRVFYLPPISMSKVLMHE